MLLLPTANSLSLCVASCCIVLHQAYAPRGHVMLLQWLRCPSRRRTVCGEASSLATTWTARCYCVQVITAAASRLTLEPRICCAC